MRDDIIAPLFETEWGRRIGLGILVGMVLLLLYTAVSSLFTLYASFSSKTPVAQVVSKDTDNAGNLITRIPDYHLFGGALGQGAVPITSLQLHLIGVIKADPEKFSRVIISERSKAGKVYQVGDNVTSGVSVYSISADGVILQNGGRLEKLPLQRIPLMFQGMPKSVLHNEPAQGE